MRCGGPRQMEIMNIVWPVTAPYFSVFAVWGYFALGTKKTRAAMQNKKDGEAAMGSDKNSPPTPAQIAIGTSHCGAGCTIADVGTEFAIATAGLTLFGSVL